MEYYFFQLFNYIGLKILARLKYTEPGHFCFEVEVAIDKQRKYNWPGIDQIAAEFDTTRSRVNAFWNKRTS